MATLTTLASFPVDSFGNGIDGSHPIGQVVVDSNGDIFGATLSGGSTNDGAVFELVNTGSGYSLQSLGSLNYGTTGSTAFGGLTMDAQGNLFGVTQSGGTAAAADGAVFELVNTGSGYSSPQTVYSFDGAHGALPTGGLVADADGNLYGSTSTGGAFGQGSVFELVKGAGGYTENVLYSFNWGDGASPSGPLIIGANGDLYGTTTQGGAGGKGTVFELDHAGNLTTLASFDGTNGSFANSGLVADANGDLFGTTTSGSVMSGSGFNMWGTVYELVNTGSGYTFVTLANLDINTTGGATKSGLTIDANGNLYGTTPSGGIYGWGAVYELAKTATGYDAPTTIYSFQGGLDGGAPKGVLTIDADGNLIGTTASGGVGNVGTVFSISLADPSNEQGNLHLTVNNGSASPIGQVGAPHVGFIVNGMLSGDTGTVTFTDQSGHTVVVDVAAGQTHYEADFSSLTDGAVSASLAVTGFNPVAGNAVTLDTAAPGQPAAPADDAVANGHVNAAHDTAGQTLEGFAEPGALVTIFDNGVQVGAVAADPTTGAWSHPVGVLADGSAHSFTVTATDAAGNESAPSDALAFTVDASAPQVSAPADAAVHNGYVNAAQDTAGQTIGGTTEAGASVAVYDNGTQAATVAADGSGAWSYTIGQLADGSAHSYTVAATDAVGNVSAQSAALSFTVDTSAPGQPAAPGDDAVAGGYVNAAHDAAGQTLEGVAEAGATVTIYDNGAQVATAVADGAGAWSYEVGVLQDGSSHSFTVTATDAAGNVSAASDPLSFTVDAGAPVVSTPTDAAVTGGYVNAAHDTPGQTIGGTTEAGASVAVFDNGLQVATVTADGAGAWSYLVGQLADGSSHSYTAQATDAAGNTGAASAALDFTVDASAPSQPTGLADAAISGGYVNAAGDTAGQALTGTAEHGATVTVYDNGVQLGTATADLGTGAWNFVFGALGDGGHSLTATVTDAAGNVGAASDPLIFTVDTAAPAAAVGSVAAGLGADVTVSGSAEAGSTVTLFDGVAQVAVVTAAQDGTWSWDAGVLAEGSSHSYAVTATDAAGNTGALSAAKTFTAGDGPGTPAAPTNAAVSGGYVNAAHDTAGQTIGGTAGLGALVTIYDNGSQVTTVSADGATGLWSYQVGVLADGSTHSYAVTQTDGAGHTSALSDALTFTVDISAPSAAKPSDASVVNGYVNAAHDTVGQALGGTTEAGASVNIYDHGVLLATVGADSFGLWSYTIGALVDGSAHSYRAQATDHAGNIGGVSDALEFTVDTTAPIAPTGLADGAIWNTYVNKAHDTAGQTLTGTAEHGALVTVYNDGVKLGTAQANATTGAWTFQLGVLTDGAKHLTATATDAAGNVSAASGALEFIVDTTIPMPVINNVTDASKGMSLITGTTEAWSAVTVFDGAQQVGVALADAAGNWHMSAKLNGGAVHRLTAVGQDIAGNVGAASGAAYWAGPSNKQLAGDLSDDVLIGAKGDALTGNGGHNHFVLNSGFGHVTVTDFHSGADQIWLAKGLFSDGLSAMAHAVRSGSDTVITDSAGDQIVLQGFQPQGLHLGDFAFF